MKKDFRIKSILKIRAQNLGPLGNAFMKFTFPLSFLIDDTNHIWPSRFYELKRMTHDGRRLIAIGQMSDSGDLKILNLHNSEKRKYKPL